MEAVPKYQPLRSTGHHGGDGGARALCVGGQILRQQLPGEDVVCDAAPVGT